jgi:hypothetical protein
MGPFLGIAAAAILGAKPTDQLLMVQAMHLRQASATVRGRIQPSSVSHVARKTDSCSICLFLAVCSVWHMPGHCCLLSGVF